MGWPVCNTTLEDIHLAETPIWRGYSAHQTILIVALVSTIIASLLSIFQILMHGNHYLRPNEQKFIVRILLMVPVYSISNFLAAVYYWRAIYFLLLGNAYAAFGLSSFFSLLSNYMAPDLHDQKEHFRAIEPKPWRWPVSWLQKCFGGKDRGCLRTPRSGLTLYNILFAGVFQYCFVLVTTSLVGVITQVYGRYCQGSNSPVFAHIWIVVVNTISAVISSYCLDQFHSQISDYVSNWKTKFQHWCINIVLYLSTYQTLLISILVITGAIKPSEQLQISDLQVSIPSALLCVEMVIVAILHLFAYSYRPYVLGHELHQSPRDTYWPQDKYHGGFLGLKALLDAVNPWDLIKSIGRSIKWLFSGRRKRFNDYSYASHQHPASQIELTAVHSKANSQHDVSEMDSVSNIADTVPPSQYHYRQDTHYNNSVLYNSNVHYDNHVYHDDNNSYNNHYQHYDNSHSYPTEIDIGAYKWPMHSTQHATVPHR